jgi:hypothetical protein
MSTVLKEFSHFPDYPNPDFSANPYPYFAQLRYDSLTQTFSHLALPLNDAWHNV